MHHDAGEGHLGSALSCVDILVALYHYELNLCEETLGDPGRDRLLFSKGHAASALYATLASRGFIASSDLRLYAKEDGPLASHPCRHALPLLDASSGSLGHCLGLAGGMLYALRLRGYDRTRAFVVLGDGECNEGSIWEAATFAAAQRLNQLVAIVDDNDMQAVGRSSELTGRTSLADKFTAFGWRAEIVDGHQMATLIAAFDRIPATPQRPTAIIAKTVKGCGVSFMEDDIRWHYQKPNADQLRSALAELGADPLHVDDTSEVI